MDSLTDIETKAKFSFAEITFLTKVEKAILNAAGTMGGNLTELKKTMEIDNTQRVFVSGSSMKWSIKKYWEENEKRTGEKISKIQEKVKGVAETSSTERVVGAQISSACDPKTYIDDDLFGYFNTGTNKARYAPVKTSGMISVFNVGPDIDNLVRYSKTSQNHSLFDKEISTNIFRSSWAIELDRIGKTEKRAEVKDVKDAIDLPAETKERRVKLFLESIFNLWLRTQQTNYLTNTQPDFVVIIFRQDKSLVIGNKLSIDKNYNIEIEALKEALEYHRDKVSLAYVATHKSFIKNFDKLMSLNGQFDNRVFVSDLITLKEKLLSEEFKLIR
jgi:CRISPR-associated protein Cst2